AVFYLAVRCLANGADRRRLGLIALLALAVVESLNVWQVWVGEQNARFQLVGTFYWHNQFGIFAVAIAIVTTAMAMRSRRLEDAIAWLLAPLFCAFAVMSQSRAALLAFALAGVALLLTGLMRRTWAPLLRLGLVADVAFGVYAGLAAVA